MEDVLAHNQNNPRQLFSSCENTSSSKQQLNLNVLCLLFAVAYIFYICNCPYSSSTVWLAANVANNAQAS